MQIACISRSYWIACSSPMFRAASRLALAACAATGGRDAITAASERAAPTRASGAYSRLTRRLDRRLKQPVPFRPEATGTM